MSPGREQGVNWAAFSSGSMTGERSTSRPIPVVGRIQVLAGERLSA